MSLKAKQEIRRKKQVLDHAVRLGNVRKTCRFFGIPRSSYYCEVTDLDGHSRRSL